MFFFAFSHQGGYDTVVYAPGTKYKAGDLVIDENGAFLCLGTDIIFPELYEKIKKKEYIFSPATTRIKQYLSTTTISLFHWLVKEYFSSYKNVIGLYLSEYGTQHLLGEKMTSTKPEYSAWDHDKGKRDFSLQAGQQCILFPSLWALTQIIDIAALPKGVGILHGGMTLVQKNKLFRGVKTGQIHTIIGTNRALFFDRVSLSRIVLYRPGDWSYSNQSDPRFVLQDTAKHIASVYGATYEEV